MAWTDIDPLVFKISDSSVAKDMHPTVIAATHSDSCPLLRIMSQLYPKISFSDFMRMGSSKR